MNFRTVYCETYAVILCFVFVNGLVTNEKTAENGESGRETSPNGETSPADSEINLSKGTTDKIGSNKRGLESSMAYPQGYFPPYHSNEMHSSVTPPYNREYDQDIAKKQLYYDTPISTGPVFVTRKSARRPIPSSMRHSFYPNLGYFVPPSSSYSSNPGAFSDKQYSTIDPYSDLTPYRPTKNAQPVPEYPSESSYPSYVYGYDPRKNYPVHTPTYQSSYQPSYEMQRGQSGLDYESGYSGLPRGYTDPQSHTVYSNEQDPVILRDGYNSELPQVDRKPSIQYQLQLLRLLEEQQRRLLQEINSQTQSSAEYHPNSATVQRRMVPNYYYSPTRHYFPVDRGVPSKFHPMGAARDNTYLLNSPTQQPIMANRMSYLIDDQSSLPLNDPSRQNYHVGTNYMLPKNKRDMEMVVSNCGETVVPGQDDSVVPCGSIDVLEDLPINPGHIWDYFELESSKHIIYRDDTPPMLPPISLQPVIPGDIPPCVELNLCNGNSGDDLGDSDKEDGKGGSWMEHRPTQKFNTSCVNTTKPNGQPQDGNDVKTTTVTPPTTSTSTTTTTTTTTMSSTSENIDDVTEDVSDTAESDEKIEEEKPEMVLFPDPSEDDDKNDDENYNEAIYQINPREARA